MNKLEKELKRQKKINDAVQHILDYFGGEMPYTVHLEQMLNAQTQIIGLMELSKMRAIKDRRDDLLFKTDEITLFLHDVHNYLQMLKPFIELLGQTGFGNEEL